MPSVCILPVTYICACTSKLCQGHSLMCSSLSHSAANLYQTVQIHYLFHFLTSSDAIYLSEYRLSIYFIELSSDANIYHCMYPVTDMNGTVFTLHIMMQK